MSLESEIKKLTEALSNLHSAIVTPNLMPDAEAINAGLMPDAEAINAGLNVEPGGLTNDRPPPKAAPLLTVEEVNAALQGTAAAMGDGGLAAMTLMQNQFGSKRLSEIPPARYAELLEKAKGLTNAG